MGKKPNPFLDEWPDAAGFSQQSGNVALTRFTAGEQIGPMRAQEAFGGMPLPGFSKTFEPDSIHAWFEAQARRTPEAVAVSCEGTHLTYAELDRKAGQLADHLVGLGVGANNRVALFLAPSLEMLVAILGVLKAGGAYVPIDLTYPADRVALILEDAAPPVLVTHSSLLKSLPVHSSRLVCLDQKTWKTSAEPTIRSQSGGQDVAYVIYTSGSTGRPKGVLVTHHNVVRLFTKTEQWYHFNECDVWTLFHSYAFDFSVWEIWGALLYGGRLVVVPQAVSRNPLEFYQLLGRENVTVLNQTPSAFRQLIHAESLTHSPQKLSLRYVIFGGEALNLQSLKPWFDRHGDTSPLLVNMYGITETTVHVTHRPIRQRDLTDGLGSVIGEPIADLEVFLLDEDLHPAPVGVAAEICVGGDGVALGYLNRPDLTAEKFIANPFGRGRLYRSGDLARRLASGELEFLGRKDQQVKIRGFRIELGEIESHLLRHPAVLEAAVDVCGNAATGQRLVAYLTLRAEPAPTPSELKEFLRQKVPPYMIPVAYVVLAALPLTSNGKLDRRALPGPEEAAPANEAHHTATEEVVAQIWASLLGVKKIGLRENLFELGADSLLLVQLLWEIQSRFNRTVTMSDVHAAPTVAQLAALLDAATDGAQLPLNAGTRGAECGDPLFYVPGVMGYGLIPSAVAQKLGSSVRFYDGLHYSGLNGRETPHETTEEIAAHLIKQIRAVSPEGPYHLCGFSFGGVVAFEIARQLRADGLEVGLLMLWDSAVNNVHHARTWKESWKAVRDYLKSNDAPMLPTLTRLATHKIKYLWRIGLEKLGLRERQTFLGPRPEESADPRQKSLYRVSEAGLRAAERYQPKVYSGDVVLVRSDLFCGLLRAADLTSGWAAFVDGHLEVIQVSGDHFSVLEGSTASVIAEKIIGCLGHGDASNGRSLAKKNQASEKQFLQTNWHPA